MRTETKLEILQKARHLIRYPEYWIQDTSATTESGERAHPHDEQAYCFCLVGALTRAVHDFGLADWIAGVPIRKDVRHTLEPDGRIQLSTWNDDGRRTHAEVLSLLDDTMERLRKETHVEAS